jgi:hypothetical protein
MALSGLFEQARDASAKGANADIARNGSTNAHSNGSKLCAFMSTRPRLGTHSNPLTHDGGECEC